MIPKNDVLTRAQQQALQGTTVEKDYVLGWVLRALAQDESLSRWVFKGGTCLKKCFFETYRFSEDLDFTIPVDEPLSETTIREGLVRLASWVEARCGVQFSRDRLRVEGYDNPRGKVSFQARLFYRGPLQMARGYQQRIKFDITADELLAANPDLRELHHPYRDAGELPAHLRTYCLEEILAEKTRALLRNSMRDVRAAMILYGIQDQHRTSYAALAS